MLAKATGDSLLIHDIYIYSFIGFCSTSDMTGYSHSYHSIKLITFSFAALSRK